jgi:La-related protein 7
VYHQQNNNQHHNGNNHHQVINRGGAHPVGTPPYKQPVKPEQLPPVANKQPPGPRMPDGTRGFALGRGKLQPLPAGLCAVEP